MRPKQCPECKSWMNEDEVEYWCSYCDYAETKSITPNWSWEDE